MTDDHFHGKLLHSGRYAAQCDRDPFEGDRVSFRWNRRNEEPLKCKGFEIIEFRYELCGRFDRWGQGCEAEGELFGTYGRESGPKIYLNGGRLQPQI